MIFYLKLKQAICASSHTAEFCQPNQKQLICYHLTRTASFYGEVQMTDNIIGFYGARKWTGTKPSPAKSNLLNLRQCDCINYLRKMNLLMSIANNAEKWWFESIR